MAAIQPPPATRPTTPEQSKPQPFLKFSKYDIISSSLMAFSIAVVCGVIWAFSLFWSTRPPALPDLVPMELVRIGGGVEDGDPNETLDIETPEETTTEIQQQEEVKEEITMLTEVRLQGGCAVAGDSGRTDRKRRAQRVGQRDREASAGDLGRGTGAAWLRSCDGSSGLPMARRSRSTHGSSISLELSWERSCRMGVWPIFLACQRVAEGALWHLRKR